MAKRRTGHYARAYDLEGPEDARELYESWAASYDTELREEYDYAGPWETAEVFARHCTNKGAVILDVGCGTGLVGTALAQRGYSIVDGVDISPAMLDQAERKGVYRRLIEADLTRQLDLATDSYDAAISVGTFTHGHVGPAALGELARVVRPGGAICFSVHEDVYDTEDYDRAFAQLERTGVCSVIGKEHLDYVRATGAKAWVVTLTVA